MASTTSFERKGFRFGMESSPASAEVKGSMQVAEKGGRGGEGEDREGWGKTRGVERKRRSSVRVKLRSREGGRERTGWTRRSSRRAAHLPRPSPPGAPSSRAAWRAGRSTGGQTGRSASSRRCGGKEREKLLPDDPRGTQ